MEYLVQTDGAQYEMTLQEILDTALDGYDFKAEDMKVYTGVKDSIGNKIYDGDVVSEEGHWVNSKRIAYQLINFAPNHGAWLRGKTQRLTPKNVKSYTIKVMPRDTQYFEVPKSGYYLIATDKKKPGTADYYNTGALIPNVVRANEITYEEYAKRK